MASDEVGVPVLSAETVAGLVSAFERMASAFAALGAAVQGISNSHSVRCVHGGDPGKCR